MTFGDFAHSNFGSPKANDNTGTMPADIGLANHKGLHSMLVEQAWSISPSNLQTQAATSDLPTAGYGRGASARIESDSTTGPLPSFESNVARPARNVEGMTLRSVLGPNNLTNRNTLARTSEQNGWASSSSFNTDYLPKVNFQTADTVKPPVADMIKPAAADTIRSVPSLSAEITAKAAVETFTPPAAPMARVEAPAAAPKSNQFDVKAHPFFANIKEGNPRGGDNFNARMERTAATTADLARLINPSESAKAADPFKAANCYESMEFGLDGVVKTTTTLPDLSASKIESRFPDKSMNVAFTDHLGRPTVENRFDSNGQLVSQTSMKFNNSESPMLPSHKVVKTASQTIETTMDATGKVVASKVMPYSDLNTATASA